MLASNTPIFAYIYSSISKPKQSSELEVLIDLTRQDFLLKIKIILEKYFHTLPSPQLKTIQKITPYIGMVSFMRL